MKHIDDLFKEELGGYAEMPPPPAWGALEKRLEEDKRRRAFPYRWFWFVGLLAFAAISGYGVANKLTSDRMASAASSLPTPVQPHLTNNTTNEQNTTSSKEATAPSFAKTTVTTSNNITHHKKHIKHTIHVANATSSAKADITAKTAETLPATVKTTNAASQYPSEEDVYEGAVASTAPLAYESTTPSGYTVNRRKKHNMVVADMSPVPEEQPHYASATAPSKVTDAPPTNNNTLVTVAQPAHKTRTHTEIHAALPSKVIAATTAKTQPRSQTVKAPAQKAMNTIALASATSKIKAVTVHPATTATTVPVTHAATQAKHPAATQPQTPRSIAATNHTGKHNVVAATIATPRATAAIASTSITTDKQVNPKPAAIGHAAVEQKSISKTVTAAAQAPARSAALTHTTQPATNTPAQLTLAQKTTAKTATIAVNNKTTAINKPVQPSTQKRIAKVATTINNKVVADELAVTETKTKTSSETAAATTSKKQPHVLAATLSKVSEKSSETTSKAIAGTTATASHADARTTLSTNSGVTTATTAKSNPASEKTVAKKPAKLGNHPAAKSTSSAITTATATTTPTSKAAKSKQKPSAPVALAAKPSAPKAAKNQPAYKFTPSIEDDMQAPAIDNLRTETIVSAGDAATPIPGTFKASATSDKKNELAVLQEQKAPIIGDSTIASKRKRFEAGIKAGFEGSVMSGAAGKFVVSPYLDYKLSSKFSVLLQPAIKSSMLATHNLSGSQTYYNAHPGDSTFISSAPTLMYNNVTHTWDTLFTVRTYGYKQAHDSVVKSYNVGGTYFEFELPVLLKYAISEKLSIYGGVNIAYSRMVRINEKTFNSGPLLLIDTQAVVSQKGQYVAPPTISSTFTYSGQPLSNYSGPLYPASSEGLIRLGYMLGFSYEFKKRWMVDALVQQCFTKSNVQGGYNTNTALSLPYMRLTFGYRLTK